MRGVMLIATLIVLGAVVSILGTILIRGCKALSWEMVSRFPGKEWKLTADCFADGRLKFDPSMIFRKYPLSQVADAFALYKNPRDVHGKIMLINEEAI